jgi:hypothetical protein
VTGSLPPIGPAPEDAGIAGSVTSQWAEVYPPDGDLAEPDDVSTVATSPGAIVATGLFVVTTALVIAGSVTPLFQVSVPVGPSFTNVNNVLSMDAWHLTSANQVPDATLPSRVTAAPIPIGYPLLVLALLAAAVVVLRLLARRLPAGQRLAGVLGMVTAGFLVGLVFTLGMFEIGWRTLGGTGALGPVVATIGVGYWLLVLGALSALLAVVIAYRTPAPAITEVVVETEEPMEIDPLVPPGQPAEWPVVAVIPNDERTNW